jgi:hypothetical protein
MYFHNKDNIESGSSVIISGEYPPPPHPGRKYHPMSSGGKYMTRIREKEDNVREKEEREKKRKWEVKG